MPIASRAVLVTTGSAAPARLSDFKDIPAIAPPDASLSARQPAKSSQPKDLLLGSGAKPRHPFLRKRSLKRADMLQQTQHLYSLPMSSLSLDVGYKLEDNVPQRASNLNPNLNARNSPTLAVHIGHHHRSGAATVLNSPREPTAVRKPTVEQNKPNNASSAINISSRFASGELYGWPPALQRNDGSDFAFAASPLQTREIATSTLESSEVSAVRSLNTRAPVQARRSTESGDAENWQDVQLLQDASDLEGWSPTTGGQERRQEVEYEASSPASSYPACPGDDAMTPPPSMIQSIPIDEPLKTDVLEQLEEAKDRITLDSLKELSANLEKGSSPRRIQTLTLRKVGMLDSAGEQVGNIDGIKRALPPRPPPTIRRSVLLGHGQAARKNQQANEAALVRPRTRGTSAAASPRFWENSEPLGKQPGQERPQTSSRIHRPKTADEIVDSALTAAFGGHRPPVAPIYPSERLAGYAEQDSILQDSKRRELRQLRTSAEPWPGLLQLNNMLVDWTVPADRPRTSHLSEITPDLKNEAIRSRSSQQETFRRHARLGASRAGVRRGFDHEPRPWTDRPRKTGIQQHSTGVNSVSSRKCSESPNRAHRSLRGLSASHADDLRPQTTEGGKRSVRTPASKGTDEGGYSARPVTSDGRSRVFKAANTEDALQTQLKSAHGKTNPCNETNMQGHMEARVPVKKGASLLWASIISETHEGVGHEDSGYLGVDQGLSLAFSCRAGGENPRGTVSAAVRDASSGIYSVKTDLRQDRSKVDLNTLAPPLEWIGTENYHRYMAHVEKLVAPSLENDLLIEQGDRVRKLTSSFSKTGKMLNTKSALRASDFKYSILARTTSGFLARTSSSVAEVPSSESSNSIKDVPQNEAGQGSPGQVKSRKEVLAENKRAKAQVIVNVQDFLDNTMDNLKWGHHDAPTSELGLSELVDSMKKFEATIPDKIEKVENVKHFLKKTGKEEVQTLLMEGRAHTAATLEESKAYVSAFYTDSAERFVDNNSYATKNWAGMTRHEIMRHADFCRELEWVKFRSGDLINRLNRQKKRELKRSTVIGVRPSEMGSNADAEVAPQPSDGVGNGQFRITIMEADNLPLTSGTKKTADTMVRCELRTARGEYKRGNRAYVVETDIAWGDFSPTWQKEIEFAIPMAAHDLSVVLSVFDVEVGVGYAAQQVSESPIGTVEIAVYRGGFQAIVAEQETTEWHPLLDGANQIVRSNQKEAMGRTAVLRLCHIYTRRERRSFLTNAIVLQNAYRCHLSRATFGGRRKVVDGFKNRLAMNEEIVSKLDCKNYWRHYAQFCEQEQSFPISQCKRQFEQRESLKLQNQYITLPGMRALGRMLVEVYPDHQLRSLDITYAGINSSTCVILANAMKAGCLQLNAVILNGNPLTQERNDVSQANNPITNRLGRSLSGCRALAHYISETTSLHRFSVSGCRLGDYGLAEIAKALQVNRSVDFLDISDTNEKYPVAMQNAAQELGKMLAENDDLVELVCQRVGFQGRSALAFLGAGESFKHIGLRLNRMLRYIDISGNNLCRSIVANAALRDYLCSDTCFLEHLDLGYNHMDQDGVLVFADGLIGNRSLKKTILDGNDLGVVGCRTLLSYRGRKTVMGTSTAGLSEQAKTRKPKSKTQVRRIFATFDVDSSGSIDVREMEAFLETLSNKDLGDAESIVNAIDKDGSGAIEFEEFYEWYMKCLGVEDDGDSPMEISLENCNGYTNAKGFDPSDPNGSYRLDMTIPTSRSTLLCMMQLIFSGKAEFLSGTMQRIEEGQDDEEARPYQVKIPDDPSQFETPQDGVLLFQFGMLRPTATIDDCVSSFIMNHLREGFSNDELSREERGNLLATCTGDDAFFRYKQIIDLLNVLTKAAENNEQRQKTLEEERVALVTRLFLRMVDKKNNMKLLDQLNPRERAQAEEILGIAVFAFDPNNPTGYHKLDLANPFQREMMMRLIEIRNSQMPDVLRWKKHLNRSNSFRDDLEPVFLNLKHNGAPFVYASSWRVYDKGCMEVDFVDIRKPDPKHAVAMDGVSFARLMSSLKQPFKKKTVMITEIRSAANKGYFNCLQLWELLCLFDKTRADESRCRVEIAVACFARIVDWRGMRRVYLQELVHDEMVALAERLGKTNIYYDEVTAPVGYWELDLSNSDDRWITQELVYLAAQEPGYNVIQAKLDAVALPGSLLDSSYRFDGIDFQLPITWVTNVPSSGVLKLFYARQSAINGCYLTTGSWDGKGTALLTPNRSSYPPLFRIPAIPDDYNEIKHGIESIWVYIEKIRVIKSALMKVSSSPEHMFGLLDTSGDGDLSRKELAMGLFRIGVWLTPVEAELLLKVVDVDSSGEVDMEEFKAFWINAPPLRMGDAEQEDYWTPRRCASGTYTEMLHFYDIRMSYPASPAAPTSLSEELSSSPVGEC